MSCGWWVHSYTTNASPCSAIVGVSIIFQAKFWLHLLSAAYRSACTRPCEECMMAWHGVAGAMSLQRALDSAPTGPCPRSLQRFCWPETFSSRCGKGFVTYAGVTPAPSISTRIEGLTPRPRCFWPGLSSSRHSRHKLERRQTHHGDLQPCSQGCVGLPAVVLECFATDLRRPSGSLRMAKGNATSRESNRRDA